jgi:hypothetical protein
VSLHRIDIRFALPRLPRSAVVLGLGDWDSALRSAGVEVGGHNGSPDLAVASSARVADAIASGATEVILEGRAGMRSLSRAGYTTRAHLPLPSVDAPDLILPLGLDSPAHYALARWRPGETPVKRARNAAAARLSRWGIVPGRARQFVGTRNSGTPMLIGAASAYGIPADARWFMTLAHGDDLTRGVFHLFPPAAREPAWVLKFARVPDYDEPFVRDEAGLGLAASAGPSVSAHAPRLQGRLQVAGHHASIETAAVGERLSTMLARGGPVANTAIDEIAAWILEAGQATAAPAEALAEERARLERNVIPRWQADPRLVTALPAVAAVLQHNDLGSWNIVWASPGRFMAVDWEAARRHGFPLWDLLYFLVDALPLVDGARSPDARAEEALRLLRGKSPSSPTLFRWVRRAAADASLPPEVVGSIATLCWLHHGLSHTARAVATAQAGGKRATGLPPVERIASEWLSDPDLGPRWSLWREH